MAILNFILFVLLPLLVLHRVFGTFRLAQSDHLVKENRNVFVILAVCNCISYFGKSINHPPIALLNRLTNPSIPTTGSIYLKSSPSLFYLEWKDVLTFNGLLNNPNFYFQMAFFLQINQNFDFIAYTPPEFLVIVLAWQLSEFAFLIFLCELTVASNMQNLLKNLFSAKLKRIALPPKPDHHYKIPI